MVGEIAPIEGQIRRHLHLKIARYNQHSNDQLDPNSTVLDFVRASFPEKKNLDEQEWRQAVGRYGVSGAMQKSLISTLSDGIKSRVVFCMIALEQPNLIVLDEVNTFNNSITHHLYCCIIHFHPLDFVIVAFGPHTDPAISLTVLSSFFPSST